MPSLSSSVEKNKVFGGDESVDRIGSYPCSLSAEGDEPQPELVRESPSSSPSPSCASLSPPASPMPVPPPIPRARPYGAFPTCSEAQSALEKRDGGHGGAPERRKAEVQKQIERNQDLRAQIARVRQRRRRVEDRPQVEQHVCRLRERLVEEELEMDRARASLAAAQSRLSNAMQWVDLAQRWNVTNDCFFIWHHGPFATINGLRLGYEAPVPTTIIGANRQPANFIQLRNIRSIHHQEQGYIHRQFPGRSIPATQLGSLSPQPSESRRYLPFSLSFGSPPVPADGGTAASVASEAAQAINSPIGQGGNVVVAGSAGGPNAAANVQKVQWAEINSALGQIALLLASLSERSGITYTHVLHPMGVASKIGIRTGGAAQTPVMYNLWSSDDGFSLFNTKQRNFTIAVQGLAQCVADAGKAILLRDPTLPLPHTILSESDGTTKVGGKSIGVASSSAEWTQAMKNLLIDVKWLVAYAAKHLDR